MKYLAAALLAITMTSCAHECPPPPVCPEAPKVEPELFCKAYMDEHKIQTITLLDQCKKDLEAAKVVKPAKAKKKK